MCIANLKIDYRLQYNVIIAKIDHVLHYNVIIA